MAIMKNAAVYFCDALGNFPGEENGNLFSDLSDYRQEVSRLMSDTPLTNNDLEGYRRSQRIQNLLFIVQ